MNFGNVVADSKYIGIGDTGDGVGAGKKLGYWNCGGEHLKRNFSKCAEEKVKEKMQKDEENEWCIRRADNKFADGKTEVKGGQLHKIFTSSLDSTSGGDFSELG